MCSSSWCLDRSVWISCARFSKILLSNKGFMAELRTLTCFIKVAGVGRELLITPVSFESVLKKIIVQISELL